MENSELGARMSKVKSKTTKVITNNTYQSIGQFLAEIDEYIDNRKISVTDIKPSVIEMFERNLKSFKIFRGTIIYFGMCHIDIELNDCIGKIRDIFAEDDIIETILDYMSMGVDKPMELKPINNEYSYLFKEIY